MSESKPRPVGLEELHTIAMRLRARIAVVEGAIRGLAQELQDVRHGLDRLHQAYGQAGGANTRNAVAQVAVPGVGDGEPASGDVLARCVHCGKLASVDEQRRFRPHAKELNGAWDRCPGSMTTAPPGEESNAR